MRTRINERGKEVMSLYTHRKIGEMTETQKAISLELTPVVKYYHAQKAQDDLDRLTNKQYYIDGDTHFGYQIIHRESKNVVCRYFSPRELVILTVDLFRSATDEDDENWKASHPHGEFSVY